MEICNGPNQLQREELHRSLRSGRYLIWTMVTRMQQKAPMTPQRLFPAQPNIPPTSTPKVVPRLSHHMGSDEHSSVSKLLDPRVTSG
mmetsp:Transcript_3502/g.5319  ORF Transcript_3502/g.5319 Transcript_3502/m.5319 type:complete len:87 (-) Transcript_3502:971-1231(-)